MELPDTLILSTSLGPLLYRLRSFSTTKHSLSEIRITGPPSKEVAISPALPSLTPIPTSREGMVTNGTSIRSISIVRSGISSLHDVSTEIGHCDNENFPLFIPETQTMSCYYDDEQAAEFLSQCQVVADSDPDYTVDLIECEDQRLRVKRRPL